MCPAHGQHRERPNLEVQWLTEAQRICTERAVLWSQTLVVGGFLPVLRNHLQTPALAGSWIQTEDSSDTGLSHSSPGLQQQTENPVTLLVLLPANQPNRNPPGVYTAPLSRGKRLLTHPPGIRRGLPAARLHFSFHLNQKQNQPGHLKERRGVNKTQHTKKL